jgi:hypothetical protein
MEMIIRFGLEPLKMRLVLINHVLFYFLIRIYIPYGLVVRIPAFHAGGPGSIPGVGKIIFSHSKENTFYSKFRLKFLKKYNFMFII